MGKVLIVSKTKMQHNHVCVGAIDLEKKKSIRLLNEDGFHETLQDCPYELLQVFDSKIIFLVKSICDDRTMAGIW